ncbi:MFS family permease [Pelomonas saccharophila]|uniref:MFS family permease n=1 Tax=Roseateles saccharophilus TaxID=304 RepID=A0ABU1YPX9_ROSSA|nr:MFS transporter [Roseateles saccharophilus]MDR7270915.1 MFS family permease [Roseateles saccharophilus]
MRARTRIFVYYLCGVFAAAQLGKLAALAPLVSRDLHLGLAAMAALTSLLEISGALLGGAAGRHLPRLGLQRGLTTAMLCLALGSAGAALAQGLPMAALARLVESLGYLVTVVAAPVLIAMAAPAHAQAAAMTLWGTFVPVGMAVGAAAYAYAAGLSDWRWAQGLSVLAGLALTASLLGMQTHETRAAASAGPATRQRTGATLWALVAAFGAYVISEVGQLALMPSLLKEAGLSLSEAGSWTALAALANVPAGVIAARLMRHPALVGRVLVICLLLTGAIFPLVYRLGAPPLQLALMAIAVNLVSGVFASLVFALLPRVAGSPERLSLASGRLTQFGASGALIGPPLVGSVVEHWGWQTAGWTSLALSIVAAGLAWRAVAHGAAVNATAARATV